MTLLLRSATAGVVWLAFLAPQHTAAAQVGHDPGGSPFRDVRRGNMIRLTVGYFGGSRGKVPIGPSDGPTGGVRYENPVGNLLSFSAGLAYARTTAFYFDPYDSIPTPQGPVNNELVVADFGLRAGLTGSKTYLGFQPYVGAAAALMFGTAISADTSGYSFGAKLGVIPEAGLRWYATRRFSVDLGIRVALYRLAYPATFRPKLLSLDDKSTEWTPHPWTTLSIGWTF